MALDITFKLQDSDLGYFRDVMRKAQSGAGKMNEQDILSKVKAIAADIKTNVPEFVAERIKQLETLVDMIEDVEWKIPEEERKDVVSALAYFGEPTDLIPDHIPALGFLDDAIMIELVVDDLRENIDAFTEFCNYREREKNRRDPATITSDDWLDAKRKELHRRMKSRRSRNTGGRSSFRVF